MVDTLVKGILGGMLLISAIQDGLYKKISLWIVVLGAASLCICIPFCTSIAGVSRFGGFMVGLGTVLLSKATGGKIGLGDGLILCVMGLGIGLWGNLEVFALALFLAAFVSIILLMLRLANRKKRIAFIPFLLLSYVIVLIL